MKVKKMKYMNPPIICVIMMIILLLGSAMQVVANQPPVAYAEPDTQTVYVGEEAWFSGNGSYDPDGYIISYNWDFGDGNYGSGVTVTHIYSIPGNYTVILMVMDNENATNTDTVFVTVLGSPPGNEPPVAYAEPDTQTVYVGEEAWFSGNGSYDPDGYIASYEWDFGDGNYGSGVTTTHVYSVPGNYTVILTVTDDDGATDTDTIFVTVLESPPGNQPPVANAEPFNQTVYVGEEAWFSGNGSYDPDGYIVSYNWDFGDGNYGSGVTITHIYSVPGNYTVTLTVTDDENATDSDTVFVTVLESSPENEPPVADIEPDNQTVYVGEEAWFSGNGSYDPDGYIVSYDWDFGDGTTGSGVTVTHIYNIPGDYPVTLTVTDDDGAIDGDTVIVSVEEEAPSQNETIVWIESLTTDKEEYNVNETINTTVIVMRGYDMLCVVWEGTLVLEVFDSAMVLVYTEEREVILPSGGMTVTYYFEFTLTEPGEYLVRATLYKGSEILVDMKEISITVIGEPQNLPPVANVHPDYQTVYVGEEAWFTGNGSYDPDGYIVSYDWDFGDGASGNGFTTTHIYTTPGNYTVTLTVTDDEGATDQDFALVIVEEPYSEPPGGNETEPPEGNETEPPEGNGTEPPEGNGTEPPGGNETEPPEGNGTEPLGGNETSLSEGSETGFFDDGGGWLIVLVVLAIAIVILVAFATIRYLIKFRGREG